MERIEAEAVAYLDDKRRDAIAADHGRKRRTPAYTANAYSVDPSEQIHFYNKWRR